MKTDDFVAFLANQPQAVAAGATARRFALALGVGSLAAILLMMALLGVRKDLAEAIHLPMFWVKLAFPLLLAAGGLVVATRLARPGVRLQRAPLLLAAQVAALWLMAAVVLTGANKDERLALLLGSSWMVCPLLIALLSTPIFIGTFWAMASLAPTRPTFSGAMAGMLAGAIAATIYSLHCPEMDAPFVAIWYSLGMAIPAIVGAVLGTRLLRW